MKSVLVVLTLVFSSVANAAQTGSGNVKTLQSAYGGWIFSIDHTNNNPNSCSKPNIKLDPSIGEQYKEIFSLILSAYTSGKPVLIYTNGCDSNGYNKLSGIYSSWGV